MHSEAFTLTELLTSLMVSSIVISVVVPLAFAVSAARVSTDDVSVAQAEVRHATIRLSYLLRRCKLICGVTNTDILVWRADDNGDGQVNCSELACIERGKLKTDYLKMREYSCSQDHTLSLGELKNGKALEWLAVNCEPAYTSMLSECGKVEFLIDSQPPYTKYVSILFELSENGVAHQYQISAGLRCWAGQLLGEDGNALVGDDD